MFVISDLISYTADNGAAIDYLKLPGINPRDPQTGIPIGGRQRSTLPPRGSQTGMRFTPFLTGSGIALRSPLTGRITPPFMSPIWGAINAS